MLDSLEKILAIGSVFIANGIVENWISVTSPPMNCTKYTIHLQLTFE